MATKAAPILDRILESRRAAIAELKASGVAAGLPESIKAAPAPRDLRQALRRTGVALIAECKERSPSGGLLQRPYDPVRLARRYAANGAAAISVLTEPEFFGGNVDHLLAVRTAVDVPVLCKDFIVDPVQVLAARAVGADAVLLIAGLLDDGALRELHALATRLAMQVVVEVHSPAEVDRALRADAGIIGINNRDLTKMKTDRETTVRLRPLIPAGRMVISESGIESRTDIDALGRIGVDAALVGEALLRAPDLDAKVRELSGR
ncbi:MAG TPA: indole-3-glycerol phosphate synthase TrpC [Candidatus Dormibacteraeota bacterium]